MRDIESWSDGSKGAGGVATELRRACGRDGGGGRTAQRLDETRARDEGATGVGEVKAGVGDMVLLQLFRGVRVGDGGRDGGGDGGGDGGCVLLCRVEVCFALQTGVLSQCRKMGIGWQVWRGQSGEDPRRPEERRLPLCNWLTLDRRSHGARCVAARAVLGSLGCCWNTPRWRLVREN